MSKFIQYPFADDGDRTAVPNTIDPSGAVSYQEGYGPQYELEQSDPDKRNLERRKWNQVLYDVTINERQYQLNGFPMWVPASDNGGIDVPYPYRAFVRYDNGTSVEVYESLVNMNTALPTNTTFWRMLDTSPQQAVPTGTVWIFALNGLPSGWVWANGLTIGNTGSGATGRANPDTNTLYELLWAAYPQSVLPIQTSTGAASTRGVSASADWSDNKRLPVPDMRGRVVAGADNMGGAPNAGRLVGSQTNGVVGAQVGNFGGLETHSLIAAQNGPHSHGNVPFMGADIDRGTLSSQFSIDGFGFTTQAGQGQPHNNVQPTIIQNYIIKL